MKFEKIGFGNKQKTAKGKPGIIIVIDPAQLKLMKIEDYKKIWAFPNTYKEYPTEPDYLIYGILEENK